MGTQVNHSVRRIHAIAECAGAKTYLEIGVCHGETFLNVGLPFKVAVDPNFRFDTAPHEAAECRFFPVTSDEFFRRLPDEGALSGQTFDIIFLDGLHTFGQTVRDFENSLRYAHDKTVWVIDDTIPCDAYSAVPSLELSAAIREAAGVPGYSWHGDVYKVIPWLHDMHPEFSYCTVMDGGNPQTVVWRAASPREGAACFGGVDAIEKMDYFSMLAHAGLYAPVREEDFLSRIGKAMPPAPEDADGDLWKTLVYEKMRFRTQRKKRPVVKMLIGCVPSKRLRHRLREKWL